MTLLQISEKIRDHLIKQKAKSESNSGACKYRNVNGDMCAVGCLIPDSVYNPNLESKAMGREEIVNAVGLSLKMKLDANTIALLKAWQNYHDIAYTQFVAVDNVLRVSYNRWLVEGAMQDSLHSPSAMHEYLKTVKDYDMTGEITKRHISQVSGFIADHLLKQGKQAATENGACRYRAADGCMCAVGCLIDQDQYSIVFEGVSLAVDKVRKAVVKSLGITEGDIDLNTPLFKVLRSWQRYHDSTESTFSKEEIDARYRQIDLMLDDKTEFPNLKD